MKKILIMIKYREEEISLFPILIRGGFVKKTLGFGDQTPSKNGIWFPKPYDKMLESI